MKFELDFPLDPRHNLQKARRSTDDFVPNASGLFVPNRVSSQQERDERRQRIGRFFSIYNTMSYEGGAYGVLDKPRDTPPFDLLKLVAQNSPIDQVIIAARQKQIKRVATRPTKDDPVGFRVVHRRQTDPEDKDFVPTPEIKARCREMEDVLYDLAHPDFQEGGFKEVCQQAVRDTLIYDRAAMVITRKSSDLASPIQSYHLLSGPTIKPRLLAILPEMQEMGITNEQVAAEVLSYKYNIDLVDAKYVQMVEGQIVAAWKAGELNLLMTNVRTDLNQRFYGWSALQESMRLSALSYAGFDYNAELFNSDFPEALVFLAGDYDEEGLLNFQNQITAAGKGKNNRLPILPADPTVESHAEVVKLRDTPQDMQFIEMLRYIHSLKCAAYRMHPSTINLSSDNGSGGTLYAQGDSEQEISLAQEEGFHEICWDLADWYTRALVRPRYTDLCVIPVGLNRENEQTRVAIVGQKTWLSVNEIRKAEGLDPLPAPKGMTYNPNDVIRDPASLQVFMAQLQIDLQSQQAQGQGQADQQQQYMQQQHEASMADGDRQHDVNMQTLKHKQSLEVEQTRQQGQMGMAAQTQAHQAGLQQQQQEGQLSQQVLQHANDAAGDQAERDQQQDTQQQQQLHEYGMAQMQAEHKTGLQRAQEGSKLTLATMQHAHQAALGEGQAKTQQAVTQLQQKRDAITQDAKVKQQLSAKDKEHARDLAQVKAKHKQDITQLAKKHSVQLARAKKQGQ